MEEVEREGRSQRGAWKGGKGRGMMCKEGRSTYFLKHAMTKVRVMSFLDVQFS